MTLGLHHESDHPTQGTGYLATYVEPSQQATFPIDIFSAFEHAKLRVSYLQPLLGERLELFAALEGRAFVGRAIVRQQQASVAVELGGVFRLAGRLHAWLGLRGEVGFDDFVAARYGIRSNLDAGARPAISLQTGLEVRHTWSTFQAYLTFDDGYGRGTDFFLHLRGFGGGFRLLL